MVGRCFWANKGTRCVSNGERRGHLNEPVRRKLEERTNVGVFEVCGVCDVVMGLDELAEELPSVSEVDILLVLAAAGVAGKLGSCGVCGFVEVV